MINEVAALTALKWTAIALFGVFCAWLVNRYAQKKGEKGKRV